MLIYELPAAVVQLCRDLSAGRLRRDPEARRIPGVPLSWLARDKGRQDAALRAGATQRRVEWQKLSAAMVMHTHTCKTPLNGFSAQKAKTGGLPARSRDASSYRPSQVEPLPVRLPGWEDAA